MTELSTPVDHQAVNHALRERLRAKELSIAYAQQMILRQGDELRVLNEVIARRKKSTRELRRRLDEAKSYHVPSHQAGRQHCVSCGTVWPCPTYIALQPSVLTQERRDSGETDG